MNTKVFEQMGLGLGLGSGSGVQKCRLVDSG